MIKSVFTALTVMSLAACSSYEFAQVVPIAETTPVASSDDAADDPAIWVNPRQAEQSLVLGTDKRRGLMVYSLTGEQKQVLARGRLNNVDIRQGVRLNQSKVDLAVASNRDSLAIDVFQIDRDGSVSYQDSVHTGLADIYGICAGLRHDGELVVFVNGKSGAYEQWFINPGGIFNPTLEGKFTLASQPEGCVVDDQHQQLYLGEEAVGIWQMPADYTGVNTKRLIDSVQSPYLKADIEGMDIYARGDQRYLVVSSQGNFSYSVYDLNQQARHLAAFEVVDNAEGGIDGSEETDGLAVSGANLGQGFEQGVLVVQDGHNKKPKANQNFKIVPWSAVQAVLPQN